MELNVANRLEGSDYVGFWKRVLISFVDFLVMILPSYLLNRLVTSAAEGLQSAIPLFIQFLLLCLFNVVMVARYGGTPGKLLLKVRIINADGAFPSLKQAVIRYSFFIVNSFLAFVVTLGDSAIVSFDSPVSNWSPLAEGLNSILLIVVIIDCVCVAFMNNKRALHDLMAGTYVVEKAALDGLK